MSDGTNGPRVDISVIVAVHNNAAAIDELHDELLPVLESTQRSFELLLVDDGSNEENLERLLALYEANPHVRIIRFARQFGLQMANTAALRNIRGRTAVIIDADLAASPRHIPDFLAKLAEGYDIVYAESSSIPLPLWQRLGRKASRWLLEKMTGIEFPNNLSGIIALNDHLVNHVNRFNEKKRHLDSLFAYMAYGRYAMVRVTPRSAKAPSPGMSPWQRVLAFWAGAGVMALSAVLAVSWGWRLTADGWTDALPAFVMTLVVGLAGLQLLGIGILGEYIGRIYGEVLQRPLYTIAEIYEHATQSEESSEPASTSHN